MKKAKPLFFLLTVTIVFGSCAANHSRVAVSLPASKVPPLATLPIRPPSAPPQALEAKGSDPVDLLIAQVDAVYDQGMQEYRSGHLEAAKQKFDLALSLLLETKLDIQGNSRLDTEFERVVENTYGLEVATLENGDTLSQHEYEPAPIESFAGLTFPVDPRVRQHIQHELLSVRSDLPLASNDYVAGFLSYFQNHGQGFIQTVLERIGRYQPMISKVLRQERLPQDLIYLAAAESAFNPLAVSRAGATGIWQLMSSRAAEYGLKRNRWVDEREDPLKSTEAAVHHLKDLYQQFGDWYLAMAAYNCGPLNVQKAIERTGYANFWKLLELRVLPRETQNYVPIIIATALIAKDPHSYGFDVRPDSPIDPDHVIVTVPTDMRLVAQLIDRPAKDVAALNPSLLTWATPMDEKGYVLNLPAGTREKYEERIASIPPADRVWWRAHKVEGGETLADIAEKYRISQSTLAKANHIESGDDLEAGMHLVLPLPAGRESLYRQGHPLTYRIRRGDSLGAIAARYHVTTEDLRRWNHLRGNLIVAGRSLRLYSPAGKKVRYAAQQEKASVHYYRIRRGDTLAFIARRYHVTVADLRRWNHLNGSQLLAGQKLRIYGRGGANRTVAAAGGEAAPEGSSREYRVQRGDTLGLIASRFHVSVADLQHWNQLDGTNITAGAVLKLHGEAGATQVASVHSKAGHQAQAYHYRIHKGDTLDDIADHFDVTISQICQWNHLNGSQIIAGEELTLYKVSDD